MTSNLSEAAITNANDTSSTGRQHMNLALLLSFIPVLTIVGNVLVVLAVYRERSLRTVTNYLIVSLAVADFLVALCVMSFAVYVEYNDMYWGLGQTVCNIYIATDVCCSTASILNLVAISVDRYIAITRPISYSKYGKNTKRACVSVCLVWAVSLAVGLPILFGANDPGGEEDDGRQLISHSIDECVFHNAIYIVSSSLMSFFIPCLVMLCLYAVIIKRLRERQHAKTSSRLGRVQRQKTAEKQTNRDERISSALLGGTKLARDMGKRLRDRTDEIMQEGSKQTITSTSSEDEEDEEESSSGHRPSPRSKGSGRRSVKPVVISQAHVHPKRRLFRRQPKISEEVLIPSAPAPTVEASVTEKTAESLQSRPPNPPQVIKNNSPKQVSNNNESYSTDRWPERSQSVSAERFVETDEHSVARSFGDDLAEFFPFIDSLSRAGSTRASIRTKSAPTLNLATFEDFPNLATPNNSVRIKSITPVTPAQINDIKQKQSKKAGIGWPHLHIPLATSKTSPMLSANDNESINQSRSSTQSSTHQMSTTPVHHLKKRFQKNWKGSGGHLPHYNSNNNNNNDMINSDSLFSFRKRSAAKVSTKSSTSVTISITRPERSVPASIRSAKDELWKRLTGMRLRSFKPTSASKRLAKKAHKQIRREQKATITLAIVLVVFLVCWLPFFSVHCTNAICILANSSGCIDAQIFFLTTWFGYMNSFMNPVIYTIFNPEYRRAFRRILRCETKHTR